MSIPPYNIISRLRGNLYSSRRGVRDGITYQQIPCEANQGNQALEGVSIQVQTHQEPIIITNLYYPSARSHSISSLEKRELNLQPRTNELILGDLTAHHQLWDKNIEDDRGNEIAETILGGATALLNDGRRTRREPATGIESTPGISLWHPETETLCEWETHEELNLDHMPITIELSAKVNQAEWIKGQLTWDWNNADWTSFRDLLDERIKELPRGNIAEMERCIVAEILEVATKKIGQKPSIWMKKEMLEKSN